MSAMHKVVMFGVFASVPLVGGAAPPVAAADEPAAPADKPPGAEKRAALGPVWSVAFAPDGLTLATGSGNPTEPGTLALWDVPSGKVRLWLGQPLGVRSVAFSPDGDKVAEGGWDKLVRVYEVRTGKLLCVLKGHTEAVNGVAFAPDGKTLASCSLDKTVFLWDVEKAAQLRQLVGHEDWVLSVAFFPDGKSLATASKDTTVRVWDVETGKERQALKLPGTPFEAVAVSPDGRMIAAGGWDRDIRLWDMDKGAQRDTLHGHGMGVLSVAFSPDGKTLASVSGNYNETAGGEIKLWNLPGGDERATLKGPTDSIWSVRFAPDGRTLATASRDQTVKLWEAATGKERWTLENGLEKFDAKTPDPLAEKDLDDIWGALAAPDGAAAQRALARLERSPEQTTTWLAGRLKPEPKADGKAEKRAAEWIAKLDGDDFDLREKATAELEKLGAAAGPALKKALEETSSAEVRQRLDGLLAKLGKPTDSPEQLRGLRALEALELINTPEARKLLQKLAEGAPEAFLTQEADASCRRLAKRR